MCHLLPSRKLSFLSWLSYTQEICSLQVYMLYSFPYHLYCYYWFKSNRKKRKDFEIFSLFTSQSSIKIKWFHFLPRYFRQLFWCVVLTFYGQSQWRHIQGGVAAVAPGATDNMGATLRIKMKNYIKDNFWWQIKTVFVFQEIFPNLFRISVKISKHQNLSLILLNILYVNPFFIPSLTPSLAPSSACHLFLHHHKSCLRAWRRRNLPRFKPLKNLYRKTKMKKINVLNTRK